MQVAYEEPPQEQPPAVDPSSDAEAHGDEGADGGEQGEGSRPAKKKRIIKSRQSLAEKKTGTTIFPMSRIKKIIKADKELDMMSTEATFLVAVATEYFIKHFMEEGYTKARLERRRIVNYKDMANVVARSDEFDFLKDVVPLPIPISEALERRKAKLAADEASMHGDEEAPARPDLPKRESVNLADAPDDLPPLAPSTNPLFPNAIVKRPPNTHARTAMPSASKASPAQPATPKLSGKNAPTTPHSLTTRGSARRSMTGQEVQDEMQID